MQTTLKEVALRAKLSEMTVSRALRGTGYVSEAARSRALEAARALGYVPNRIAGSLASQRTNLVGIVVPSITNNVYAQVLSGIAKGLEGSGLQPVFAITGYEPRLEEALIRDMLSWRPSGLAIAGLRHTAAARRMLAGCAIPVVEMMDVDGRPVSFGVGISPREAGRAMARHLVERGYRAIAYVAHDHRLDVAARKRHDGFVAELRALGLEPAGVHVDAAPSTQALGRRMTAALLDATKPANAHATCPLEAIAYSNDDMAVGGLMACLAHGLRVPEDIALCGYSGTSLELELPMRLTTVRSPRFEVGERSARYLLERIAARTADGSSGCRKPRPSREVLPACLVRGETT
ncbi:MAG: LacI family DNA-binding transcriptional regulator [Lautropia sp.]